MPGRARVGAELLVEGDLVGADEDVDHGVGLRGGDLRDVAAEVRRAERLVRVADDRRALRARPGRHLARAELAGREVARHDVDLFRPALDHVVDQRVDLLVPDRREGEVAGVADRAGRRGLREDVGDLRRARELQARLLRRRRLEADHNVDVILVDELVAPLACDLRRRGVVLRHHLELHVGPCRVRRVDHFQRGGHALRRRPRSWSPACPVRPLIQPILTVVAVLCAREAAADAADTPTTSSTSSTSFGPKRREPRNIESTLLNRSGTPRRRGAVHNRPAT